MVNGLLSILNYCTVYSICLSNFNWQISNRTVPLFIFTCINIIEHFMINFNWLIIHVLYDIIVVKFKISHILLYIWRDFCYISVFTLFLNYVFVVTISSYICKINFLVIYIWFLNTALNGLSLSLCFYNFFFLCNES